jgi:hypothetical protein
MILRCPSVTSFNGLALAVRLDKKVESSDRKCH